MIHQLAVSEIFGPTFQGEGKFAGRRTSFLRLGSCNLNCSWCDTSYTWDWTGQNGEKYDPKQEIKLMFLEDVANRIDQIGCKHLVVTGGEPMLQQKNLLMMLRLMSVRKELEIETNGTIEPTMALTDYVTHYDVSPKLTNSGIPLSKRLNLRVLKSLASTGKASFKFVVKEVEDLMEVDDMVAIIYESVRPVENIWIMPEGRTTLSTLMRARLLADEVLKRGYNLTLRQHVLLWGIERAR